MPPSKPRPGTSTDSLKQKSLMNWFSKDKVSSSRTPSTTTNSNLTGTALKSNSNDATKRPFTTPVKRASLPAQEHQCVPMASSPPTTPGSDPFGPPSSDAPLPSTSDTIDVDTLSDDEEAEDVVKQRRLKRKSVLVDSDEDEPPTTPASTYASSAGTSADFSRNNRLKKPRLFLDEDEDESMASESATSAISEKLSRFRKSPSKKRRSKSQPSDDDDFVVPDDEDEEVSTTGINSISRPRSQSVSSRASTLYDDEADSEDATYKKRKVTASTKSSRMKVTKKGNSDQKSGHDGQLSFLTAAEQRLQNKKDEKKSSEDPYSFLANVTDKDGHRPGDPKYDPRSLYVPKNVWASFTPFEKQFWEIKQYHYDTILFFQKGKFFELYEEDARIGHREFDLKLTQRVKMSMVGVPEMSFNFWAAKFLAKGYKVGKVEQSETALGAEMRLTKSKGQKAQKTDSKDKIVRRELNKVFTNGTLVDPELISDDNAGHCICIREEQDESNLDATRFGICALDCSTSQFDMSTFQDDICRTKLETMMRQLRPKELLYKKESLSVATMRLLKTILPAACIWTGLRDVEGTNYDETLEILNDIYPAEDGKEYMEMDEAEEVMLNESVPSCIREMRHSRCAIEALGCTIWYLKQLNIQKDIMGMKNFNIYDPMKRGLGLTLDGQALAHLEVLLNNEGTEEGSLFQLLSKCVTPSGKRLFRIWLCMPLREVSDINARLDAVEALMNHPTFEKEFMDVAKGLPDLERIVARIHANSCKIRDFVKVLASFRKLSKGVRKLADESEAFESKTILQLLCSVPDLIPYINDIEALYEAPSGKDMDELVPRSGKDEAYDDIMDNINDIENKLDAELKKLEMKLGCSLNYWHSHLGTKDIYLVETKSAQKNIPKDWTKASSTKAINRWNVPALQSLIRSLKEERENRNAAIKSFRARVYFEFDQERAVWLRAIRIFSELDCLFSLSKASSALDEPVCRPEFVEGDEAWLEFETLRHPALESKSGMFIPNDIKLGSRRGKIALLTGPNMAGKSTVMRMTAVGVIMSQLGMLVPASKARLSPVDAILTRMGAYDNMFSNASTFKVELDECCKVLRNATPKSLVILDELGRGTSTYDGMAIAAAVLHQLATHTIPLSFFATHYGSLTDDMAYHPNIRNMHMSTVVNDEKKELVFLYKLVEGVASGSFGTHVANLAGLPTEVVERADVISKSFAEQFKTRVADKQRKSASARLPLFAQADFTYLYGLATGRTSLPSESARQRNVLEQMKSLVLKYGSLSVAKDAS